MAGVVGLNGIAVGRTGIVGFWVGGTTVGDARGGSVGICVGTDMLVAVGTGAAGLPYN